jgi:hypothetical protein
MKKVLPLLLAFLVAGSLCFADEVKTLTGKVESVTKCFPKPPNLRFAIIGITSDGGEKVKVSVVKDTVITDASGKDMCPGGDMRGAWKLKKDERVEIKYLPGANSGNDKAVSIHCLGEGS